MNSCFLKHYEKVWRKKWIVTDTDVFVSWVLLRERRWLELGSTSDMDIFPDEDHVMQAAKTLVNKGYDPELIDIRSLKPLKPSQPLMH